VNEVARELAVESKIALRIQRNKEVRIGEDEEYPNRNTCKGSNFVIRRRSATAGSQRKFLTCERECDVHIVKEVRIVRCSRPCSVKG
jgi:hypothetical protein